MRISDWGSDVCSSDLRRVYRLGGKIARSIGHIAVERDLVIAERNLVASVHRPLPFGQPVERCRRQIISGRNRRDIIIVLAVLIRSEEHTSELQSLMRISYAVFCLKKTKTTKT